MKISIVTTVFNGEKYIEDCLRSVAAQNYPDIEHIVVDGASTDRTLERVHKVKTPNVIVISEKDRNLYDGINRGLKLATGEVVGILNSDDFYKTTDVISSIIETFRTSLKPVVIGNLELVDPLETTRVKGFISAEKFKITDFLMGELPPHPAFFARRDLYVRHGDFNITYPICADYDLMLRFLYLKKEPWAYLPKTLVCMRTGGISNRSWLDKLRFNSQKVAICHSHGVQTNLMRMFTRYPKKIYLLLKSKFSATFS